MKDKTHISDGHTSDNDRKEAQMLNSLSWFSCSMVAMLALGSFTLSFEALRALVVEMKIVSPDLAWIFPLIVDGAIVVFSLSALRASLRQEKTLWLRSLVIFATLGSMAFNIAHVEATYLSMILAGTPPTLLFLSFEALMHSIQAEMTRTMGLVSENPKIIVSSKAERQEAVRKLKKQGLSASEMADRIEGASLRTIQRDLSLFDQIG